MSDDNARALADATFNVGSSHGKNNDQHVQPSPAVTARIAGLQRLPELTLDEVGHAQECYAALLGERKECISTAFELRVILGQFGLYPSEGEMELVIKAARQRVDFTALTRYLRFCKREFEIAAASTSAASSSSNATTGAGANAAGSSRGPLPGDADTLRAFVALGGNEDGSGEVSTALLDEVVRNFQLTIDIQGMIASTDVSHSGTLDYNEFCFLWAIPEEALRRHSLTSISAMDGDSALFKYNNTSSGPNHLPGVHGAANNWNAMTASHRQLVASLSGSRRNSMLQGPQSQRNGLLSQSRRKSSMINAAFGQSVFSANTNTNAAAAAAAAKQHANSNNSNNSGSGRTALEPLSEEERLQLLRAYLMPEKQDTAVTRKARLAPQGRGNGGGLDGNDEGANGNTNSSGGNAAGGGTRLPAIGGSGDKRNSLRRMGGRGKRGAAGSGGHGNGANGNDGPEDVFSLQKSGNGVYQPPSPMILFQRNRTRRGNAQKSGSVNYGSNRNSSGGKRPQRMTSPGNRNSSHMSGAASTSSYAAGNAGSM